MASNGYETQRVRSRLPGVIPAFIVHPFGAIVHKSFLACSGCHGVRGTMDWGAAGWRMVRWRIFSRVAGPLVSKAVAIVNDERLPKICTQRNRPDFPFRQ